MKVLVSEKQYESMISSVVSEQDDPVDAQPKSGESEETPTAKGYPKVTTWEEIVGSTLERGAANQIKNTKWSDVVGSKVTRGAANQLSEQSITGFNPMTNPLHAPMRYNFSRKDLDKIQSMADIAGIVPVIGDGIDFINSLVYFARSIDDGKFMPNGLNGLLSIIGVIPVVGSAMSIPMKALFKTIPMDEAGKIIKSLTNSNPQKIVQNIRVWALKSDVGRKAFDELVDFAVKYQNNVHNITDAGNKILDILQKIPGKLDNKLYAITLRPLLRNLSGIIDVLVNLGKSTMKSVLKIRKIPANSLSQYGRLAYTGFGLNIKKAGAKRMFYASQDMYMQYLKKEGSGVLINNHSIAKQAIENLGLPSAGATEDLVKYAARVGVPEDKIMREITNLSILNKPQGFDTFLKSADAQQRFNRFIKTITDPNIVFDATETWGAMRKAGFKYLTTKAREGTRYFYPTNDVIKNAAVGAGAASTVKPPLKPDQTTQPATKSAATQPQFKESKGFPLNVGDRHASVGYVQKCLKLPVTQNFDETTKAAIIKAGYDLSNGLTWKLFNKIMSYCKR